MWYYNIWWPGKRSFVVWIFSKIPFSMNIWPTSCTSLVILYLVALSPPAKNVLPYLGPLDVLQLPSSLCSYTAPIHFNQLVYQAHKNSFAYRKDWWKIKIIFQVIRIFLSNLSIIEVNWTYKNNPWNVFMPNYILWKYLL